MKAIPNTGKVDFWPSWSVPSCVWHFCCTFDGKYEVFSVFWRFRKPQVKVNKAVSNHSTQLFKLKTSFENNWIWIFPPFFALNILVFKTIRCISLFLFEVAQRKRALFALSRHFLVCYFFMFTYVVTGDFGVWCAISVQSQRDFISIKLNSAGICQKEKKPYQSVVQCSKNS